jgi:hypothetical protein
MSKNALKHAVSKKIRDTNTPNATQNEHWLEIRQEYLKPNRKPTTPEIFLLRKKTKKKFLNGGTNKVTRRNHYLSIVHTHHSLIEKEGGKRKINAKIKEKHELKWSTYQNTKERPSTSTFRTGTDVNIHCKLLHCPHHPKKCPNSLSQKSEPNT